MSTTAEKTPKIVKKTEQPPRKGQFSPDDLKEAVLNAFREVSGRVDAKYLWTDGGMHRFRVNIWVESTIQKSEFVRVIEEGKKLTVRRSSE